MAKPVRTLTTQTADADGWQELILVQNGLRFASRTFDAGDPYEVERITVIIAAWLSGGRMIKGFGDLNLTSHARKWQAKFSAEVA